MTSTDIATRPEDIAAAVGVPVGALAIRADQTEITEAQQAALGHIGLANAPKGDVKAFLHLCQRVMLDPWARQIYLIERGGKWTPQTAIDGFRVIAERRPEFAGTTDILWCGEDGVWTDVWLSATKPPYAARCSVKRHDRDEPITATALFAEFTAGNAKWKSSPAWMIGKCAEAGALRRAFPQDFAGLYIDEEMQALTAQRSRARVESHRDGGPVEVGELTGQRPTTRVSPAEPHTPPTGPAATLTPPVSSNGQPLRGGKGKPSAEQTKRLFAALRRDDGPDDSQVWAAAVLGRERVSSWSSITADECNLLISRAEAGQWYEAGPPADEPVDAEVVEQPAAAAATESDADDDHAEEYAQLEAERDAATDAARADG